MPSSVVITQPGSITGPSREMNGVTYWPWSFNVVVDGQAGVFTLWCETDNPADEPAIEDTVIDFLSTDPGALGGIGQNDPGTGDSDRGDGDRGDPGDGGDGIGDGDDDGALADGGTGGGDGDSA